MINEFRGQYRWLSNFWPVAVGMDGCVYPSVEHAYQAAKTADHSQRIQFQGAESSPGMAKRLGRSLVLRKAWDDIKLLVMLDLLRAKFKNSVLRGKLLATGDQEIIEGNTRNDTFWGVCRGVGQNNLGRLLMQVRQEIRDAQ